MPVLNELLLFPQASRAQAVFLSYQHGQIIAVNQQACMLYGYTEKEFLQMNSRQLALPSPELQSFQQRLRQQELVYAQMPVQKKSGEVFDILVESRLIQNDALHMVKVVPVTVLEGLLNPERDKADLTPLGNWELDFASKTIQLDATLQKLNGKKTPRGMKLKAVEKYLVDKRLRSRIGKLARNTALYGIPWTEIFPMVIPGNGTIWVQCYCTAVYRNGSCIGLKGTLQDITVFKQLEEIYAEQTVQLNFLLENINHAVTIRDANLNLLYYNERVLELFGYDKELFSRMKPSDLVYWEDQEKTAAIMKKVKEEGSINDFENRIITKSGEVKTISWSFVWIRAVEKLYAVGKDITHLKQVKREFEGTVLETGEEEKQELFTELHENICQTFAAAQIYIGTYMSEGNSENLLRANEMIRTGLETARALAAVHLFPDLKLQTFAEALQIYILELNKSGRTRFTLDTRSFRGRDLPLAVKTMLYRIIQILTTRIIQNCGAPKATLKMGLKNSNLRIVLQYTPGEGGKNCLQDNSKTIDRLQSRIDQLGGSIELQSETDDDCRVVLELDLLKYDGFSFLGRQSVADE